MSKKKRKITLIKEQAIEDLCNKVHAWDADILLGFALAHYRRALETLSVMELEDVYCTEFYIRDSDDEYLEIIDTKATKILFDKKV